MLTKLTLILYLSIQYTVFSTMTLDQVLFGLFELPQNSNQITINLNTLCFQTSTPMGAQKAKNVFATVSNRKHLLLDWHCIASLRGPLRVPKESKWWMCLWSLWPIYKKYNRICLFGSDVLNTESSAWNCCEGSGLRSYFCKWCSVFFFFFCIDWLLQFPLVLLVFNPLFSMLTMHNVSCWLEHYESPMTKMKAINPL